MYYGSRMNVSLKFFSDKTVRISIIATIFVILAFNGAIVPSLPHHDDSRQLNCAIAKAQVSAPHSTIVKCAPFIVFGQRAYELNTHASHLVSGHQEFHPPTSLTTTTVSSRAPPASLHHS